MSLNKLQIADAKVGQLEEILSLLPRLASFDLPQRRKPEELWEGDADLLRDWAQGKLTEAFVKIAVDEKESILGVAFAQLRKEALSQKPSAHLEVLVVAEPAQGRGVARALMAATEEAVKNRGAKTLTLNVFGNNAKARGLYRHLGFEEELLRCIKDL